MNKAQSGTSFKNMIHRLLNQKHDTGDIRKSHVSCCQNIHQQLDGTQVRHSTNNERYLASSDVSGLQHPEHMVKNEDEAVGASLNALYRSH
jgi:hypothetical protein